jgi:hypothetical protein
MTGATGATARHARRPSGRRCRTGRRFRMTLPEFLSCRGGLSRGAFDAVTRLPAAGEWLLHLAIRTSWRSAA